MNLIAEAIPNVDDFSNAKSLFVCFRSDDIEIQPPEYDRETVFYITLRCSVCGNSQTTNIVLAHYPCSYVLNNDEEERTQAELHVDTSD